MSSQQAQLEETCAVCIAKLRLNDRWIKLSRSNFILCVEENIQLWVELHRVLDNSQAAKRSVVEELKAQCHQTFEEGEISQMRDSLSPSDQNIFQRRHNRLNVVVIFSSVDVHDVLIQMRVESRRVYVEYLTLSWQNCENCLDAVKLFAIAKINVLDQEVEDFNQIGEKLNVDDVCESKISSEI